MASNEIEARILAAASYIEAMRGDRLELDKALRIVEKHRGELLGPTEHGGGGAAPRFKLAKSNLKITRNISPFLRSRYRALARH